MFPELYRSHFQWVNNFRYNYRQRAMQYLHIKQKCPLNRVVVYSRDGISPVDIGYYTSDATLLSLCSAAFDCVVICMASKASVWCTWGWLSKMMILLQSNRYWASQACYARADVKLLVHLHVIVDWNCTTNVNFGQPPPCRNILAF